MPFNLAAGLQDAAAAGTGYFQGEEQEQNRNYSKEMQNLAYQNAALDFDQKKQDQQRMQALSDHMMQAFKPQPVGPQPSPGPNPQQQMSQLANTDPEQYTQEAFNFAAQSGDITRAEQLATNLSNFRGQQADQQAKAATIQNTELKARQQALQQTGEAFQDVTDQPSYDRVRMSLMADSTMPQSARQAIASLPEKYSPAIVDHIKNQSMSLSEQAKNQLAQARLAETIRSDNLRNQHNQNMETIQTAREKAYEQHQTNQTKVGGANSSPTSADKDGAAVAIKEVAPELDPESPEGMAAIQSVASRGKQIMKDNRAVNAQQAMAMAADEAKKSGEFTSKTIPGKYNKILGDMTPDWMKTSTTKPSFKQQGDTKESAIPYKQGMTKDDLVKGKIYQTSNGPLRFTGTGWERVD